MDEKELEELTESLEKERTKRIKNNRKFSPSVSNVAAMQSYKVGWNNTGWMNIDAYLHMLSKGEKVFLLSFKTTQKT